LSTTYCQIDLRVTQWDLSPDVAADRRSSPVRASGSTRRVTRSVEAMPPACASGRTAIA
jgi:hypothetical protein